jgi:hypothetical protein
VTDLLKLYRDMADTGMNFHGLSVLQHEKQIGKLIQQHRARTLLDYGCGRGDAYRSPHKVHQTWGLRRPDVHLYDPSFGRYANLPLGTYDAVICSDVLEHIPEEQVDAVIERLFAYAKAFVWASVCCRPAKKTFPGTDINLHVTVKDMQWWLDTFEQHAGGKSFFLVETP